MKQIHFAPLLDKLPRLPEAAVLCILLMSVHLCLAGTRVSVTLSAIKLGLNTLEVGMLIASFALLPMLFSVVAGRLIDKVGPFRPMRLAAFVVTAGTLLPLLWLHWISLAMAAVCAGVGHMAFQISVQGQLGAAPAQQRLRNYSWLSLALAFSGFSGPLIAGLSIDNLGNRWAFGLLGLFPLFAALVVLRLRERLLAAHIPKPVTQQKQRVTDIIKIRPLRNALLANLMLSGAWDTHAFLIPIYGAQRELSATTIGTILASFSLATFLIRIVLPMIQKRVTPWQLIHFAMITAGLNFMLYPLFSDVRIFIAMSFILGLSLGCTQPSILALLQQHAPDGRKAEVFGVRMALINGTQVSLPLAFGAVGSLLGVMPLFWATALAVSSGAFFTRNAGKIRPTPAAATSASPVAAVDATANPDTVPAPLETRANATANATADASVSSAAHTDTPPHTPSNPPR